MQTTAKQTERSFTNDGVNYVWSMQAEQLGQYWPVIIKYLLMVEHAEWTTDWVFEEISAKRAQVWGAVTDGDIKGIWITKIITERVKYGLVWIAAGVGNEKVSLNDGLQLFLTCTESWFKEMGCEYVKIIGRRGWKKMLPDYVEHAVELRKQL